MQGQGRLDRRGGQNALVGAELVQALLDQCREALHAVGRALVAHNGALAQDGADVGDVLGDILQR